MYARQVGLDEFETRDFPWKLMNPTKEYYERANSTTFDDFAKDAPGRRDYCQEKFTPSASQDIILLGS